MAQISQTITTYTGTVPDQDTQTRDEFNSAVDDFLDWWIIPPSEINTFSTEANALRNEVNTFQSNASTSASNAATSESNASTSETNAAASESAAATSETNAATSESNAGTYETDAYNWAERIENDPYTDADGNSGYSALHHKAKAAASASAASTSETNAATSASNASTSESNAATSATESLGFRDQSRDARDDAQAAEASALASANFKGAWSDLTGSLGPPASVLHTSEYWTLLNYLADVTLEEPTDANVNWEKLPFLEDAPSDGTYYARRNSVWTDASPSAPVQSVNGSTGTVTVSVPVDSVAGKTGAVTLAKGDVGLGNVPNEDATNPDNMDQAGANIGQALVWSGTKWGPGSAVGVVSTKSAAYTLSAGDLIHADTSGGAFTLSCPASPADGDFIGVRDKASSFATNNLTLDGNGKNILGDATFIFDVDDQPAEFEFNSSRNEWIFARR